MMIWRCVGVVTAWQAGLANSAPSVWVMALQSPDVHGGWATPEENQSEVYLVRRVQSVAGTAPTNLVSTQVLGCNM